MASSLSVEGDDSGDIWRALPVPGPVDS